MRLLHYNDDGDFSSTEFFKSAIPEYAILSHTWEGEEVTFEDLQNGTSTEKAGYEKIRFCAEQAIGDGLRYFWVDTCCIDKSNSAELAEAINSMFRWYRMSTKCYVYLSDVSSTAVNVNNMAWEAAFRKSRWFTRGWTLQELLAPISVEFFCRESKRIGCKSSLEQQIYEITGIPKSALQGTSLSKFSDKERFSWIQPRETKVEEDKAYSLLGIFDVRIPLRYGEGMTNAFKRLEEEIDKFNKCLRDLRLSDPCDDKTRIEDTKGGLLEGSYHWVLETSHFQLWRDDQQSRLLWIKGDPGKGKTMLLCGIINELEKSMSKTDILSYFFCQATDSRINHATAVLRGLLYLLINQQPSLISHIQKKYTHAGKSLFEDVNAWIALSEIFTSILQDPWLRSTFLIIDALDECLVDRSRLLDFIVQKSSISPHVKWVISSRNWPNIEERLERVGQQMRLCLELNSKSVSAAVRTYVKYKTRQLADEKSYDDRTREAVLQHLVSNADDTFLWVALVYENLKDVPRWRTLGKLKEFPPGLDLLYQRMLKQIFESDDADLCKQILAIALTVYRPITLMEITSIIETLVDIANDYKSLADIIGLCGSFLSVRENTIFFVHQSAKDFLMKKATKEILPLGIANVHQTIFSRSVLAMSNTLRRDIYGLCAPGISIDQVKQPHPNPLAAIQYSCLYWVDHLLDCDTRGNTSSSDIKDCSLVNRFLCQSYLYWLEALSLMRSLSSGILMIRKLESWFQANGSPDIYAFIYDTKRFALYNRSVIEKAPLQIYCSALILAPMMSLVRKRFAEHIPNWIQQKSTNVEKGWNAVLQTLEEHSSWVNAVAFSPNGTQLASASEDTTIRLWDVATGAVLQTLRPYSGPVYSIAFSPNNKQLASASYNGTVWLWDIASGAMLQTLEGHSSWVNAVAFSPNGTQLASASEDTTIRLWDVVTGAVLQIFQGHLVSVNAVAFSLDGKQLASSSPDGTVRWWDAQTGVAQRVLEIDQDMDSTFAFSPNSKLLASTSDETVKLWNMATGKELATLKGHQDTVSNVTFSLGSKILASLSYDRTVKLWDTINGAELNTLQVHITAPRSIAFSPTSSLLALTSEDDKAIKLWDTTVVAVPELLQRHLQPVSMVIFSPNGRLIASASDDNTIKLWESVTGELLFSLEGHTRYISDITFSPDSKLLASASADNAVRLWDTFTGDSRELLSGHVDIAYSVAFSSSGKILASASFDSKIILRDLSTGTSPKVLSGHRGTVYSICFSLDCRLLASGSTDMTVKLWGLPSGAVLKTLIGHSGEITALNFSPDSNLLASASNDRTIKIWDVVFGMEPKTLVGHTRSPRAVAFSPNGRLLASASWDKTVRLWDTSTGMAMRILEVDAVVNYLSFSIDGLYLETNRGLLDAMDRFPTTILSPPIPAHGIFVNEHWVARGEKNIFYLPSSYNPGSVAVYGNVVALGHTSGLVSILEFNF